MQSVYCAGQVTKNVRWMALLSSIVKWGHKKHETKRNLLRHIEIKMCFCVKKNGLAKRKLCSQTETKTKTKWLVARQVLQWANSAPAGRLKLCE